jgi:hypothetical protein
MPDYQNGKIYKIWSPEGDDIYIGSTTEILCRRLAVHKSSYNIGRTITSRILFEKYTDVRIELIEEFPCDKKSKLIAREGHYIRILNCVNKIIPDRTNKEYCKEYYEQNKDSIGEQRKEYYKDNKEHLLEYQKEYRENNKDIISEKKKEYYEQNKERRGEKIKCECGCEVRRDSLTRHKLSQKHIKLMQNI